MKTHSRHLEIRHSYSSWEAQKTIISDTTSSVFQNVHFHIPKLSQQLTICCLILKYAVVFPAIMQPTSSLSSSCEEYLVFKEHYFHVSSLELVSSLAAKYIKIKVSWYSREKMQIHENYRTNNIILFINLIQPKVPCSCLIKILSFMVWFIWWELCEIFCGPMIPTDD